VIGKTLGNYQIVEELGRGGMAVVYRAYQPSLNRYVAIKVLPPQLGIDQQFVERFQREARAAARLRHPNIVVVHDVGHQDGIYYIVMEYLEGRTLKQVVEQEGSLPLERVARIVEQVAAALDYAHQEGFVHRDVKPANIFVGKGDHVTLTDFGIAKAASETQQLTRTGMLVGTPEYMSPEQAQGAAVDRRTDLYALGIVLYHMLVGRVPYQGTTPHATLHAILYEPPPPPRKIKPNIPAAVEAVVLKAIAKQPNQRYQSGAELATALRAALSPQKGTGTEERPAKRPFGLIVMGAGLAVLACVLITVGLIFLLDGPKDGEPTPLPKETSLPLVTQVVTNTPRPVVTMVVTVPPQATETTPPTSIPTAGPLTVRVAPDGSGDYPSLEAAVQAADPGSTIALDAGTYQLAGPLELDKPLRLKGAGIDQTTIVGTAEGQVVLFTSPGLFAAEEITFRHEGTAWARVVTVDGGEIDVFRCRFTGAIWDPDQEKGGDGLLLWGNTTGSVRESLFEENELNGIELQDQSQPLLEGNTVANNGQSGIVYFDDSGGVARHNDCSGNQLHGISVNKQSQPTLEGNTCRSNGEVGIRYSGTAGGEARQNEVTENGLHGIVVNDQAQPTLQENVCTGNLQSGIVYFGDSGGLARANQCTGNAMHGIGVQERAMPTLEENICTGNSEVGIIYFDQASGAARRNTCNENGLHGIGVNEEAQPTLEENVCENNTEVGIRYTGSSGGVASGNACNGNGLHGFALKDQAQPTLEMNVANNNTEGGFVYFDSAGGVARLNECVGNKWGFYISETAAPSLEGNNCSGNSDADVEDLRP
jgi:parallel beta-helix repeat protein